MAEISKITITNNGKELELSLDEARELYLALDDLFDDLFVELVDCECIEPHQELIDHVEELIDGVESYTKGNSSKTTQAWSGAKLGWGYSNDE